MTKAKAANEKSKIPVAAAREYRDSRVCQCGNRKTFHCSLCFDCLQEIPELLYRDLHAHLYATRRAIGAEYALALENALDFLDLPLPPAPDLKTAGDVVRTRHDATAEYRDQANPATFLR